MRFKFIFLAVIFLVPLNLSDASADPGELKWRYDLPVNVSFITIPIFKEDNTIYFATAGTSAEDRRLYALDSDGNLKWTFTKDPSVWSYSCARPAICPTGGDIYLPAKNRFFSVSKNGKKNWHKDIDANATDPAIGPDGTIYIGTGDGGYLYAYNHNGKLKWTFPCPGTTNWQSRYIAVSNDGVIYITSDYFDYNSMTSEYASKLYAINPDGTLKWQFDAGCYAPDSCQILSPPSIALDGTIYVIRGDGVLYAINPTSGSTKFSNVFIGHPSGCRVYDSTPLTATDGTIFFSNSQGHCLEIFSSTTGQEIMGSPIVFTPYKPLGIVLGDNNVIYILLSKNTYEGGDADEHILFASDIATGNEIWQYPITNTNDKRDKIYGPVMGPDGTVYVTDDANNCVYAIETGSNGLANSSWPVHGQNIGGTFCSVSTCNVYKKAMPCLMLLLND